MWKWLTKRSVPNGAFLVIWSLLTMNVWEDQKRMWQHSIKAFWFGLYTAIPTMVVVYLICLWWYYYRRTKAI